jgi:hypothetical protein
VKRQLSPAEKILKRLSKKTYDFQLAYDDGWRITYRNKVSQQLEILITTDLLYAAEQIYVRLLDACPYHGTGLVQVGGRLLICPRGACGFETTLPDA